MERKRGRAVARWTYPSSTSFLSLCVPAATCRCSASTCFSSLLRASSNAARSRASSSVRPRILSLLLALADSADWRCCSSCLTCRAQ